MKVIAIAGMPASGKSTLMREIIKNLWITEEADIHGLKCLVDKEDKYCVLGVYPENETFGGTDRYPMNIQPTATKAITSMNFECLFFEGDRLFNMKFLEKIVELGYDLRVFWLVTSHDELDRRHYERDQQNETWLLGRATKLKNIRNYDEIMGGRYNITELENESFFDTDSNTKKILEVL